MWRCGVGLDSRRRVYAKRSLRPHTSVAKVLRTASSTPCAAHAVVDGSCTSLQLDDNQCLSRHSMLRNHAAVHLFIRVALPVATARRSSSKNGGVIQLIASQRTTEKVAELQDRRSDNRKIVRTRRLALLSPEILALVVVTRYMLRVALGGGGADYSAGDMFKTAAGEGELSRYYEYIIKSFGAGELAGGLAERFSTWRRCGMGLLSARER